MGWWENNAGVWGDGPADQIDAAIDEIVDQFKEDYDRPPTKEELAAGFQFSLNAYDPEDH